MTSKQQNPRIILKDKEALFLVVQIHDTDHPDSIQAYQREAGGKGQHSLLSSSHPFTMKMGIYASTSLGGTSRVLHEVEVPV